MANEVSKSHEANCDLVCPGHFQATHRAEAVWPLGLLELPAGFPDTGHHEPGLPRERPLDLLPPGLHLRSAGRPLQGQSKDFRTETSGLRSTEIVSDAALPVSLFIRHPVVQDFMKNVFLAVFLSLDHIYFLTQYVL